MTGIKKIKKNDMQSTSELTSTTLRFTWWDRWGLLAWVSKRGSVIETDIENIPVLLAWLSQTRLDHSSAPLFIFSFSITKKCRHVIGEAMLKASVEKQFKKLASEEFALKNWKLWLEEPARQPLQLNWETNSQLLHKFYCIAWCLK